VMRACHTPQEQENADRSPRESIRKQFHTVCLAHANKRFSITHRIVDRVMRVLGLADLFH